MLRLSFMAAATVAFPLLLPAQQADAAPTVTITGPLTLLNLGSGLGNGFQNSNSIAFDHGTIDFTNVDNAAPQAGLYSGSVTNVALSPYPGGGAANYLVAQGKSGGVQDTVTIRLAAKQTMFGLLWGSVDTYNTLDFYDNGALTDTVTGAELAVRGIATNGTQSAYVMISGLKPFDQVVAVDYDQPAFEFMPDPVPEPRSIALLSLGVLGLALVHRVKRSPTA
jgi:hypothetical protein